MPTFLPRFTIDQPKTLAEASEMLRSYGEDGRAYAGGTELLLAMKHAGLRYSHLVDVKTIPGLDAVEAGDRLDVDQAIVAQAAVLHDQQQLGAAGVGAGVLAALAQ